MYQTHDYHLHREHFDDVSLTIDVRGDFITVHLDEETDKGITDTVFKIFINTERYNPVSREFEFDPRGLEWLEASLRTMLHEISIIFDGKENTDVRELPA